MKHFIVAVFMLGTTLIVRAQVQQGYVKTIGRENAPGHALDGVTLQKALGYYLSIISNINASGGIYYTDRWEVCYENIVKAYNEKGQYDKSISLSKKIIGVLDPSRFSNSKTLAKINGSLGDMYLFEKKDYLSAEEAFHKQVEMNQHQYEFDIKHKLVSFSKASQVELAASLNSLAYAFTYQGKHEEALNTIDLALELRPEKPNYYDSKGEILFRKGDMEGARTMWNKVVAIDPKFNDKYDSSLYKLLFNK